MVAREGELAVLHDAVADAMGGLGRAVCVVGPAGIGKTRLAAEVLRIARDAGFRCAWGVGWLGAGAPPLWPWQSVLTQLGGSPDVLAPIGADADHDRFVTFSAVADAVSHIATTQPVLIVIDDAHAADPGALLLARFVVRSLRAAPLLVVVTARDMIGVDPVDPVLHAAIGELARDTIVVRPAALSTDDLAALLDRVGRSVTPPQIDVMHDVTGGNPLFVGELLAAGSASVQPSMHSVRTILQLRLGGLTTTALEVLAVAAALGPLARIPLVMAAVDIEKGAVLDVLSRAEAAGVLTVHGDQCRFAHDLLAESVLAGRSSTDMARLHERVAFVLEHTDGTATEHVLASAHHRVAIASIDRKPASVEKAVISCQRAARVLVSGVAYESASQLLAQAVGLHDTIGLVAPASLLLEVARTELAAGNLRGARSWFRRAAEQADDPAQLAQAAVGLGGIWVHEHRTASDHAAFMALVDRALVRLNGDRPDLMARLHTRRAAELIYTGHGSASDVRDAVDAARQMGDPLVLAESLSLWHHTLLGPANTNAERIGIADELIGVAAMAGDEVLGLMGVLWRAVDLYLIGDRRAERALTEVRVRADALHVAAVLFVLDAIEVMRLLRDGRIDAAEHAAQRCFDLGAGIGDADAMGYYGGHLLTIRWMQMQPDDILPLARQVAQSPTLVEGDVAPRAAAAVLAAMLGDDDQARADLHHVMTRVPRSVETSSNWMITMFCAAEAAMMLSDLKTAEAVYSSLLPYRHLPIMGSLAVVCLGSAERSLGVAARTLGDVNLAVHHFEQAVEQNHRLGNRVMAAISDGDLGCALIERAMAGDVARGRAHVETSVDALNAFGLVERARRLCSDAAERLRAVPVPDGEIARTGATWRLTYGDHVVEIADSVGVQRLRQLLERPWIDVTAAQLAGELESSVRHDVNDVATLRAYRGHIDELHRDIDQADADYDLERAAQLRVELDELLDHLGPSIGLNGRSRAFADGVERARVAVRKSLGRVFDAVGEQDAEFAERLHDSIKTGVICRFEPVDQFPAVWHSSTVT